MMLRRCCSSLKVLRLRNIRFFNDGVLLQHGKPQCEFADYLSTTFNFQKRYERNNTVTQKDTNHAFMSPFKIWYAIVNRIRGYREVTLERTMTLQSPQFREMEEFNTLLERNDGLLEGCSVEAIREEKIGFKSSENGTHSICFGAAICSHVLR